MTDELKKKIDIQEKEIKSLNDVILNLKNILDSKEAELTARTNVSESHKKLNGELRKELDEVKADNKKLAQQVEDLEIEAKDMLAYP
jgi:chromosome segregation ATPase